MANKPLHKPGERVRPGEYVERGPRGGEIRKPRQVTIKPSEKLPPTRERNNTWERVGPPEG